MQRPPCGAVVLSALMRLQLLALACIGRYRPANITANQGWWRARCGRRETSASEAVFEREIDPVARTGDAGAALPVVAILGDVDSERQPRHVQSGERHDAAPHASPHEALDRVERLSLLCHRPKLH